VGNPRTGKFLTILEEKMKDVTKMLQFLQKSLAFCKNYVRIVLVRNRMKQEGYIL
jgi:hypothetical protein